tara:strand:- start:3760 stop:4407 length:648 start_codon:yes stop_codon:yes gene_type:complete
MKHFTIDNLKNIENEVQLKRSDAKIIAVSKTFKIDQILPLINYGHIHFGENKVQETLSKWQNLKLENSNIKLHFVGKLQTNKVKHLLPIIDYIHSLDNLKLAKKISDEQIKKKLKPKLFVQINFENEIQKSGIAEEKLEEFLNICQNSLSLDIVGLMCLPPNDGNHLKYFKKMKELKLKFNLKELSMGMSNDYSDAIDQSASFVRIGSKIFGPRS